MAHNPQAPYGQGQGPEGSYDPAGNTQMFRAFVDEGAPQRQQPQAVAAASSSGPRIGLIVGVVAVVVILAAVAWLALG